MTTKSKPILGWIRNLPEGGNVGSFADREEALLARREDLLTRLQELDAILSRLRVEAKQATEAAWSTKEIRAAKDVRAADLRDANLADADLEGAKGYTP